MSVEINPTSKAKTAGIRRCDLCEKEQHLLKPRRWDICLCCERKQGYKNGNRKPPRQVKKQCYICYCETCKNVFEVKSKALWSQKHCSSKCAGEKLKGRSPANKIWKNKEERTRFYYNKYYNNLETKVRINVRSRVKTVLKTQLNRKKNKYKGVAKTEDILGCTIEFFVKYIESQFEPWMTWSNHGHDTWHIDHIIPLSAFDLTDDEQLKKAMHYTNQRPLKASENFKKHAKIIEEKS
jgi:hypothetical protein